VAVSGRWKLGAEILLVALAAAWLALAGPALPYPLIGAGMTVLLGFSVLYACFAILVWSQADGEAASARDTVFWLRQTAALFGIVALHTAFRFSLAYPMQPHYPAVAFPAAVALILLASRGMPDLFMLDRLRRAPAPPAAGLARRGLIHAAMSANGFPSADAGEFGSCFALRPLHKEAAEDAYGAPGSGGDLGQRFGGSPPAERYLSEWEEIQKSTFDLTLATLLLPFLCPVMLVIAVAIWVESRGPILFRQPRAGLDGRTFTIFKFRTMYHHMTDIGADRQTSPGDPRVTRVGRILRRYSLDEFPQLWNVFRGDMSLVGPRPHAPQTKAAGVPFAQAVQEYYIRQSVKPGITGWAQVNGSRGEVTTIHQLRRRVAYDLFYITNWSVFFDIKIIVLTIRREVFSQHAC
jgi:lipopolysaccharide/colanic/teichoic acid biosynthesis glycosyltransferase